MSGIRMLNQKQLKDILRYCPETGVFTWKIAIAKKINAGDIAGYMRKNHNGTSYLVISINYKKYSAHRLAVLYMTGKFPIEQTDHRDGNGLNNRWLNLKCASQDENMKNLPLRSDNISGVCGVSFDKQANKWASYISVSKKVKKLGRFIDKWDAICVRKSAERRYGYHENHGLKRGSVCRP